MESDFRSDALYPYFSLMGRHPYLSVWPLTAPVTSRSKIVLTLQDIESNHCRITFRFKWDQFIFQSQMRGNPRRSCYDIINKFQHKKSTVI